MEHVADVSPKYITSRPIHAVRLDRDPSSNIRTRMDPLSDLLGSMSIRRQFISVWRRHHLGYSLRWDPGPRIRFGLVVRGSALLKFKNSRRTFSLSAGDLFIFILSDEPFTLMDHPRFTCCRFHRSIETGIGEGRDSLRGRRHAHNPCGWSFGMSTFGAPLNF